MFGTSHSIAKHRLFAEQNSFAWYNLARSCIALEGRDCCSQDLLSLGCHFCMCLHCLSWISSHSMLAACKFYQVLKSCVGAVIFCEKSFDLALISCQVSRQVCCLFRSKLANHICAALKNPAPTFGAIRAIQFLTSPRLRCSFRVLDLPVWNEQQSLLTGERWQKWKWFQILQKILSQRFQHGLKWHEKFQLLWDRYSHIIWTYSANDQNPNFSIKIGKHLQQYWSWKWHNLDQFGLRPNESSSV